MAMMFTLTATERRRLRCAQYAAAATTGTFIAACQLAGILPTGVLL